MSEGEQKCSGCGALLRVTSFHVPYRDPDSANCPKCGVEVISWKGSRGYTVELVKPAPKKKAKKK
jgi:predicted RNA-binding Zn-ribbon protein involved in translation (DUF1610 family)